MEDKNQFVDKLLDSALAHQRGAEPRVGFEARILERVRAAGRQSSRKRFRLTTAATAAAVLVFVAIYVANRSHRPAVQSPQTMSAVPAPSPREPLPTNSGTKPTSNPSKTVLEAKRAVRRERKPARQVESPHWPSQFPTPAPLSPEEKALVQYVRETPPQVLAASLFKGESMDRPVKIKPLKIAPLEIRPLAVGPAGEEIQ